METTVVIVGAGQAGLAMSRCLTHLSIDHVLLEKGATAQSWRSERWDSLRLLTPNWLSRLPDYRYGGPDPDGFMTAGEVVEYLEQYKTIFSAPVVENAEVLRIGRHRGRFRVETADGTWTARAVVVASGATSDPTVPPLSAELPRSMTQLTPITYRNPSQIDPGRRVLVVGGATSGIQIADELARSGRDVTIAVGEHLRVPRSYRGMDLYWWMASLGSLDERYDAVDDLARLRSLPSPHLIGSVDFRDLDLNSVQGLGVQVVGRLVGAPPGRLQFSGGLLNTTVSADLKQNRLLASFDTFASSHGLDAELGEPTRPPKTRLATVRTEIGMADVGTVIWATGYRPRYPWLDENLLDAKGAIRHDGGVMAAPGMYVLGLRFLRRRKSNFIDGVGPDARELGAHLVQHLDRIAAHS